MTFIGHISRGSGVSKILIMLNVWFHKTEKEKIHYLSSSPGRVFAISSFSEASIVLNVFKVSQVSGIGGGFLYKGSVLLVGGSPGVLMLGTDMDFLNVWRSSVISETKCNAKQIRIRK